MAGREAHGAVRGPPIKEAVARNIAKTLENENVLRELVASPSGPSEPTACGACQANRSVGGPAIKESRPWDRTLTHDKDMVSHIAPLLGESVETILRLAAVGTDAHEPRWRKASIAISTGAAPLAFTASQYRP